MTPVVDSVKINAQFAALVARARTKNRDLLREAGEIIVTSVVTNFERGGRYSMRGGTARGGALSWLVSNRAMRDNGQTLVDTGRLRSSITARIVANNQVAIGTNVRYAAIHHYGGEIKLRQRGRRGNERKVETFTMPARPFLVVQDEDIQDIRDAALYHIRRALS